jgi:hypothetical protein
VPAKYEQIRDFYVRKGLAESAAKTKAAKIYNGTRTKGEAPVTRQTPYKEDGEES